MRIYLTRRYDFEAAHQLNGLPEHHKCSRVHGHNYRVEITVSVDDADEQNGLKNGMVLDAEALDVYLRPVLSRIDHRFLNELGGDDPDTQREFEPMRSQPTAENIARWAWKRLAYVGNGGQQRLEAIRVYENERLWAEVRGE